MKFKQLSIILMVIMAGFATSCTYDQIEPEIPKPIPPDKEISFATDIQPIFTAKCVKCHPPTAGLDLSVGKAYDEITATKYMDLANPAESKIYKYPNLSSATHSYEKYSTDEAALLLQWITDGAPNN